MSQHRDAEANLNIFLHGRQGPFNHKWSVSRLLATRQYKEPGHQQPRYWSLYLVATPDKLTSNTILQFNVMWGKPMMPQNSHLGTNRMCCRVIQVGMTHQLVDVEELFHNIEMEILLFDKIFITGCTRSCHFDNFLCNQWWKFCQNDISSSVYGDILLIGQRYCEH